MRYLYIDTSSSFLYSAIVENNTLIEEVKQEFGHNLSEEAMPAIISMFEKSKLNAKDIDKIIVVNGPGSFTGIRIGITIAKVYAWSLNIPITTITSIEAMAISTNINTYKVPMLDARRGYVFTGIFDSENNVILEPSYLKKEELNDKLTDLNVFTVITNDNTIDYQNQESYTPDFLKIIEKFKDKENLNPHGVNPNYLKLTEAEESKL